MTVVPLRGTSNTVILRATQWSRRIRPCTQQPDPTTARRMTVASSAIQPSRLINVKREVLVVDCLVRAVFADFLQGLVQALDQLRVALAHGNGNLVIFKHRVALELEVLAGIAFQPFPVDELVRQYGVQAARGQIQIGVFVGVVQLDEMLRPWLSSSQLPAMVARWAPITLPFRLSASTLKSTFFGAINCKPLL